MGLFGTPLALGLCITVELGRAVWVEQRLFTTCSCGNARLGTHPAGRFLLLCLLLPECGGDSDWMGFPAVIPGQHGLGLCTGIKAH